MRPRPSRWRTPRALIAAALGCLTLGALAWSSEIQLASPRDPHGAPFAGAGACQRCHPAHFESWARTFHRRMTQPASEQSVLGDFDDAPLPYFGVTATATRDADGAFRITYPAGYGPAGGDRVVRSIGSRRTQQYVAERNGALVRLPFAWHVEDDRWVHMNGAFLTPDPVLDPALAPGDFERHVTRWNDNCIFCHNVGPNPGRSGHGFDSSVAELGVACEACHGPADAHAAENANPLRRYRLHTANMPDPSIVNPARLSPERAADVCGRCHGQRITDDIDQFLREGDPFVPGDDLAEYSAPLWQDTTLQGHEGVFAARFWADGTARLTAYEYQGLLQSPCAMRGELTCTTCHGMHEGAPEGQIRPAARGAAMCTGCHAALDAPAAQARHARHRRVESAECIDCHMPRIVYGVMETHPSHRIELPDPARAEALGRPDACTLCHMERTRAWAIEQRAHLWGGTPARAGDADGGRPPSDVPEVERALLAGDPIERAVAAAALGRGHREHDASAARQASLLTDVMLHERYPAVRRLAWRSLAAWAGSPPPPAYGAYRADTPLSERRPRTEALRRALKLAPPDAAHQLAMQHLRARAPVREIHIGE